MIHGVYKPNITFQSPHLPGMDQIAARSSGYGPGRQALKRNPSAGGFISPMTMVYGCLWYSRCIMVDTELSWGKLFISVYGRCIMVLMNQLISGGHHLVLVGAVGDDNDVAETISFCEAGHLHVWQRRNVSSHLERLSHTSPLSFLGQH